MPEYTGYEYGYRPYELDNSPERAFARLESILNDKVMRFNPYSVSDDVLLACVERARWLPWPTLVQMVVFSFKGIIGDVEGDNIGKLVFNIGNESIDRSIPIGALLKRYTHRGSRQQIRCQYNGRNITNSKMIEDLIGKDCFISYSLIGEDHRGNLYVVYRMFSLRKNSCLRAQQIRQLMCEAKVMIAQEIINYPWAPEYLHCRRSLIDFMTPISQFINTVEEFPNVMS